MPVPAYVRDSRLLRNIPVPMRDGVTLATTAWLPRQEGRYPVVLVRTAYNRTYIGDQGLTREGIAIVSQDTRGRYGSNGDFVPFLHETRDGLDTLDWLAAQPWCNGKIAMFGDSYLAGTQFALAAPGHPNLVSLNPRFMSGDMWRQAYYCDGVFSLALSFSWLCMEVDPRTSEAHMWPVYDIGKFLLELPLLTLDEKVGGSVAPAYREYVTHPTRDQFWRDRSWRETLGQTRVPMLLTAGWYDYYPNETFRNYAALMAGPAPDSVKRGHRVIVGPWTHGIYGGGKLGQLDFGPEARREEDSTSRWLQATLKGAGPEEFQRAPIRIFTMGDNRWRDEHEWPLARTRFTKFFLHSDGAANACPGDGALSPQPPGDEKPDRFSYDPANPVPTLGGNHSVGPYNPGLYDICLPGPYDQRPLESRDDVLVYSTDILDDDLDVTGPVVLTLFASSSALDTDFIARLTDVHPDGRSMNITEGVLRARYRARRWDQTELLEPGKVYEFTIELQPTSNVFKKGHRLRLDVSSSNFPLWDRNLNTGEPPATGTQMVVARQTILHDRGHPSHLLLPVIPRG